MTLDVSSFYSASNTVCLYEFKAGINAYLAAHPIANQAISLQDLISFDTANAATVMPYFGQEVFISAQATTSLSDPTYIAAKQSAHAATSTNGIDAVMTANSLDALISPTTNAAWKLTTSTDPPFVASSGPAAVAGYPHLTVPMGAVGGLPVGMSFFGRAWDDAKILALGYAYEQLALMRGHRSRGCRGRSGRRTMCKRHLLLESSGRRKSGSVEEIHINSGR